MISEIPLGPKVRPSAILLCGIFVLVVCIVLLAAVPPVSKDALVHHLAVPKLYLKNGGMYEIPLMPFSYYPMNLQLLYLFPLAFGNDIGPKFIHFMFALMTALGIHWYIRRRLGRPWGLLGALLFLSIPIVVKLSITAYIDLGVVFFILASILSMFAWSNDGFRVKWLLVSAAMCGLALGTKYNALIALFILTLYIPIIYGRKAQALQLRSHRGFAYGLLFFLISLLVFSPWMIRNYKWTGNPIYPLYQHWFQGPSKVLEVAGPTEVGYGIFTYRKVVFGEAGWEIAMLPIRVFFQGQDGAPRYFDGKLHPFLLFLPLFAFLRLRRGFDHHKEEKYVLIAFSVLFFAFAFFTQALRIRYIAPIIPPLVILSVFGARNLFLWIESALTRRGRIAGSIALAFGFLIIFGYSAGYLVEQFQYVRPLSYLSGSVDRDTYITQYRPEYPVVQYANRNLPDDSKILLVFMGRRGYYLDRDYIPGVDQLGTLILNSENVEYVLQSLRRENITHLLVYTPIFEKWVGENLDQKKRVLMTKLFQNHTRLLCFHKGYTLIALEQ